MSDLTPHERQLADVFAGEHAPASTEQWQARPPRRFRGASAWSKPAAAVAAIAVVAGGLGGYFGLRGHVFLGGGAAGGALPAARADAAIAYDEATGTVVMFGGRDSHGKALDDTWTWNGSGWSQEHPATSPPALSDAVMAYDAATKQVVLFGGDAQGPSSAAAGIGCAIPPAGSGSAGTADVKPPVSALPSVELTPACTGSPEPKPAVETWTWDGSTWRHAASGGLDFGIGATWAAADPVSKHVLLVSRLSYVSNYCSSNVSCPATPPPSAGVKTWSWDGQRWQLLKAAFPASTSNGIPKTDLIGLVTDPVNGRLAVVDATVSFARCLGVAPGMPEARSGASPLPAPLACQEADVKSTSPSANLTDWTGTSWGPVRPLDGGPSTLPGGSLTYDAARRDLVFVGMDFGAAETLPSNSTWVWDGTWSRAKSGPNPLDLGGAASAFDARSGQIVRFGGVSYKDPSTGPDHLPVLDTTWTFDGTRWTLRSGTQPSPPSPGPTPSGVPCPASGAPSAATPSTAEPSTAAPSNPVPAPAPLTACPLPGGSGWGFGDGTCSASWSEATGANGVVDLTFSASGPSPQCAAVFHVVDAKGAAADIWNGKVQVARQTLYEVWSNWCGPTGPLYLEDASIAAAAAGKDSRGWIVSPPACNDSAQPSVWTQSPRFDGCPSFVGGSPAARPGLGLEPACPIPAQGGPPLHR